MAPVNLYVNVQLIQGPVILYENVQLRNGHIYLVYKCTKSIVMTPENLHVNVQLIIDCKLYINVQLTNARYFKFIFNSQIICSYNNHMNKKNISIISHVVYYNILWK